MAYTRHGKHIPGTPHDLENAPAMIARCSGPSGPSPCVQCVADAELATEKSGEEPRKNMIDFDPARFVPQYYEMNPETDDVIRDGTYLRNGMRVLVEDPMLRQDLAEVDDEKTLRRAKLQNLWCEVQDVKIGAQERAVYFVAIYDDGVKRKRVSHINCAWIVKKDSIPVEGGDDYNYGAHLDQ